MWRTSVCTHSSLSFWEEAIKKGLKKKCWREESQHICLFFLIYLLLIHRCRFSWEVKQEFRCNITLTGKVDRSEAGTLSVALCYRDSSAECHINRKYLRGCSWEITFFYLFHLSYPSRLEILNPITALLAQDIKRKTKLRLNTNWE